MAPDCVNIGPRQRARRVRIGLAFLVVFAACAVGLVLEQAARPWRALVFLPLLLASISLLQVRAKTCIALAARGQRDLDHGEEPVPDPAERQRLALQARRVLVQSAMVATAGTALVVLWY